MKKQSLLFGLFFFLGSTAYSQEDVEGCKDHPMFPNRMSNFFISECKTNFDAVDFNVVAGGAKIVNKEGTKTFMQYNFNTESGQPKPSVLQILRNYENAAKKIGGTTVFLSAAEAIGTFKIMKNGKETVWVKVECGGNDSNDFYTLTILQLEAMTQEITSDDMLTALNTDGHIALYINFDTGKSDIKPESQKIIDQIQSMLTANPALKISIEGHTDNTGVPASNKTLSENRAKSVMSALVSGGTDKTRLVAKGWGQDKPIAENTTDDGKAKNRRVEIVKL